MAPQADHDARMRPGHAIAVAFAVAALFGAGTASAAPSVTAGATCHSGYYKNVYGRCVHSPSSSSAGATARCTDGTYSYSQSASGTCSHHGGVARWIHHP
jgi:hypothetical protein